MEEKNNKKESLEEESKTMNIAFWDNLESEMKEKKYNMLLSVLDELRVKS